MQSQPSGFPLLLQKNPGLFQDPQNIFPGCCRSTAIFKCKDKWQLLTQNIQCGSTINRCIAEHSSQIEKKVQSVRFAIQQEYFIHFNTHQNAPSRGCTDTRHHSKPARVKQLHLYRSASPPRWLTRQCVSTMPSQQECAYRPTSVNVYTVCYHEHMCMCKHAHLYRSASQQLRVCRPRAASHAHHRHSLRHVTEPVVFTAHRNASAAMLALQALYQLRQFRLSVCPSVRHTPVLSQNDGTQHGAVCTVGQQNVSSFAETKKIFPRDDRFPLKSWL